MKNASMSLVVQSFRDEVLRRCDNPLKRSLEILRSASEGVAMECFAIYGIRVVIQGTRNVELRATAPNGKQTEYVYEALVINFEIDYGARLPTSRWSLAFFEGGFSILFEPREG